MKLKLIPAERHFLQFHEKEALNLEPTEAE
jgi:hypothetical protein